jgi:3-hydroxyacyl-[acyl-carrier-protein] dehydratase
MPGVLILEAMAQVGCVLVLSDEENHGKLPLVAGIEGVRFKRPVTPGDRLQTRVEAVWLRTEMGKFRGEATVDGELVATAEIVYKLVTREF